ncbi:MAG: hypothetical protein GXO27_07065, partial [Chlorobi bacterium]|nr:hypothetical protein [Chlorobiota bacterium]
MESNGRDAYYSKKLLWDEANRLRLVKNELGWHYYLYDDGGERAVKAEVEAYNAAYNGQNTGRALVMHSFTMYPNAYMTVRDDRNYTKHYFAGSRRLASTVV